MGKYKTTGDERSRENTRKGNKEAFQLPVSTNCTSIIITGGLKGGGKGNTVPGPALLAARKGSTGKKKVQIEKKIF